MWPSRTVTDLLGIEHPIVQAPMAGSTTPALAAAVGECGGLGSIGCAGMTAQQVRATAAAIRDASNRGFNLNFFAHRPPRHDPAVVAATRQRLRPHYAALGLGEPPTESDPPFRPFDEDMLKAVLEIAPLVASFHFGLPAAEAVAALKQAGVVILSSATTVAEAVELERAGADAIIAQGWEAGGHRGAFAIEQDDAGVGTLALVPQVVDAVAVPVIAAGGIGDGRGIAAAFALGAGGVQIGTAFLSCPEANVPDIHRKAIAEASDSDTRLTKAFSGRPARARNTRFIAEMADQRAPLPEFPLMYGYSAPLRAAEDTAASWDYQFLLYGQAAALNRARPARELMQALVADGLARISDLAAPH